MFYFPTGGGTSQINDLTVCIALCQITDLTCSAAGFTVPALSRLCEATSLPAGPGSAAILDPGLEQAGREAQLISSVYHFSLVFWFGDLNFRIDDLDLYFVKSAVQGNKLSLLWEKDQLNMAKCCEHVLSGFMEGPLTFPPTYKYDVGTNIYDTSSKKRKPAWTDRILWKMKNPISQSDTSSSVSAGLSATLLSYGSHMQYTESDHKPVSAIFTVKGGTSHYGVRSLI
ncbi:unnamed protein product [Ranitomeya imitator]|uniref:phosphoinositide 5-phosphatase n=1 Tax=Ranitomeya imitator TaxID=111125 RepID=A0ABN9MMC4_9NEOB|nr:unnamed protein product [Ranitomeya imitator]